MADTGNDGFGSIEPGNIDLGDFVGDGNDQVIFRADTTTFGAGVVSAAAAGLNFNDFSPNFAPGTVLAFIWIDGLSLNDLTLSGGEMYGIYTNDTEIDGSTPFVVPADGATVTLNFFTMDNSAFFPPSQSNLLSAGRTTLTVGGMSMPPPDPPDPQTPGDLLVSGTARLVNERTLFMGNTYNGFEMSGSSATFTSFAGEITRVSFLDPDGDIVFAEFGSDVFATELTIDLADSQSSVPSPYTQPGTTYTQGDATFTIANSTSLTFFSIFSLGNDPTRVDNSLINATTLSDPVNGIADISRVIVSPSNGGSVQIGGINAANANFIGNASVIGVDAEEATFGVFLFVGDITPSGTATPWLRIDPSSTIAEILINGGDLREATGDFQIDTNGIVYTFPINATDGQRSIANNSFRPDLGDGSLQTVTDTFQADKDAYFLTDGQN